MLNQQLCEFDMDLVIILTAGINFADKSEKD